MNILRLLAELGLNAAPFNKGMDSARSKASASAKEIGAGFKQAFSQYLGAAVIIQTLRGITREIDNIEDSSQRLGLTTEQFQRLSIAADRAGQSLQGGKGIGKVFNEIAELRAKAEGGDIKASKQLGELGLSMLGAADASETMHDAFTKVINLSDTKLAEVFGGRVLLDIKALREEMAKVANQPIFTDDHIRKVKEADEALKTAARGLKTFLVQAYVGAFNLTMPFRKTRTGGPFGGSFWKDLAEDQGIPSAGVTGGAGGGGGTAKLQAALAAQRIDLERELAALETSKRYQGQDMTQLITTLAQRFGGTQALIGTGFVVDKPKPLNPELKKKMDDIIVKLDEIAKQEDNVIKISR